MTFKISGYRVLLKKVRITCDLRKIDGIFSLHRYLDPIFPCDHRELF